MLQRSAVLLMLLLFFCSAPLCAEQGFYQEVGPDGHVRTIKLPQKPGIDSVNTEPPLIPGKVPESAVSVPAVKTSEKFAPYNGDDYLDSDRLEASGFNPEKKSRFYIVNNGMAARVEENLEADATRLNEPPVQSESVLKGFDLPSEREETTDVMLIKSLLMSDTLCVPAETLKAAKSLAKRRSEAVLIDKKTLQYKGPLGVVGVYKFSADGMKMLTLRSYAKNERSPGYASPMVAMADANGCVSRVVSGYFQSRYEPTQSTHSMLQGAVRINADEPYLLLIASEHKNDSTSYSRSLYGQLSIKWQP